MIRSLCAGLACVVALMAGDRVGAQASPTKILERVRVDTRKQIDFHAAVFPDTVYVGQQSTYQVAVFLNADARSKLRRNPEFLPPELRGLLAYELGTPTRIAPQMMNGAIYEAHVFQRAMFPVATGKVTVPAPQLTYAMPQSSSYFSREERTVVLAESAQLVVRPIPGEGRPDDFSGAVGTFTATSRMDTATARVGEPLVFTLRVQGVGNVKLLPRPLLEVEWASTVAASERVHVDSSGSLVRGYKEFDWILTPSRDGTVTVPAMPYSYFDPYKARFGVALAPSFDVGIGAGVIGPTESDEQVDLLPLRTSDAPGREWSSFASDGDHPSLPLLVLCLLAPLPAALIVGRRAVARRRATRVVPIPDARQRLAQLNPRGNDLDSRAIRRLLHGAIADRLQVPASGLVAQRQMARALRRRGVTRETTTAVIRFLDDVDAMTFAEGSALRAQDARAVDLARTAGALYAAVDGEAVRSADALPPDRRSMHAALLLILMASVFVGAPLAAQSPQTSGARSSANPRGAGVTMTSTKGDGVLAGRDGDARRRAADAYQRRQFTQASEEYAALSNRFPVDIDVLANWGAASWAAGDTVNAVIAWQRAARLAPLDASLQEHLALLPSGARGRLADVPLIPVPALTVGAAIAWILGWLLLALGVRVPGRATGARTLGTLLLVLSLPAAAGAWYGREALRTDGLGVVLRPETMHVAPGSDADAVGGVSTGDMVRFLAVRDDWRKVEHSDGRRGWLPAARLTALLDSAPSR